MMLSMGSLTWAESVVLASAIFFIFKTSPWIIGCLFWKPLLEAKPPPGIEKLTDHVWEFYSPEGPPDREIIFFHGLQLGEFQDAFWETWVTKKNKLLVWPKEWLSKKFPRARILSVSYNSSATRRAGQLSMYALAENLFHDIILGSPEIGQKCPVFLVAHCFGGIVIKRFILFAKEQEGKFMNTRNFEQNYERVNAFLTNFSGVFYYATPHGGSEVANLASRLPGTSPILELVKPLNTETAIINNDFSSLRKNLNVRAFGVAEGLPSYVARFGTILVVDPAARQDIDYLYTHQTADHFTVCKARNRKDVVIEKLVQFIKDTVPEELKVQADVGLQHQGGSTSNPQDPTSHPVPAIQKLSEQVELYIRSVNDKPKAGYFISRTWWDKLEKQQEEALLSAFERNSYRRTIVSSTKICFSRTISTVEH